MGRFLQLLVGIDFATAGLKTYLGLLVCVAALVAGHRGYLTPSEAEIVLGVGIVLALGGKVLADRRPEPPAGPPAAPPAVGGGAALLALLGLLALAVGCVPVEALEHVREQHAIMAGHALDESLPLEARQIGADAMRAMSTQHRVLDGEPLESPALPPELAPAEGPR